MVCGDAFRLRQILMNLLGNAIKFTPVGEVALRVRLDRGDARKSALHFTVSDTGVRIAPNACKMIFDPFTQADSSTTRTFGGTGLGLAISARLVTMMAGAIWVESELGCGSQFHFTALLGVTTAIDDAIKQVPTAASAVSQSLAPRPSPPLRILLAEDNAVNRLVARTLLEKQGHHVEVDHYRDGGSCCPAPGELRRRPDGRANAGHGRL